MMSQLQEYIQTALASGQSREAITQSLAATGWKTEDIEAGFGATTPTTPMPLTPTHLMASSVSTSSYSKLPTVLAIGAVITIPLIGVAIWALTKSTSTPEVSGVTTSQAPTSEIDKYGTELFALKEGETKITAQIDNKPVDITYIRSRNSDERVPLSNVRRCITNSCTAIDLDAKYQLQISLAKIDEGIKGCKAGTVKEGCDIAPAIYENLQSCLTLQDNEEIGACVMNGAIDTVAGTSQPAPLGGVKEHIDFVRADAEKELLAMINSGQFKENLEKAKREYTRSCVDNKDGDISGCLRGSFVFSSVAANCKDLTDDSKLKACVPAVLDSIEKMVNDNNK